MPGRSKQHKFAEMQTFSNVYQFDKTKKGNWAREVFKNNNPITIETGCGKGDYCLALAKQYPDRNFIGIDVKGARLWAGAKKALAANLPNVAFLRIQIDHIAEYFDKNEVSNIWITFPDPFLKKSKSKKRLTSLKFLQLYQQVLKPGSIINFKTDSPDLYNFTLDTLNENKFNIIRTTDNLYTSGWADDYLFIKTHYEKMHLANGLTIKYVEFKIN